MVILDSVSRLAEQPHQSRWTDISLQGNVFTPLCMRVNDDVESSDFATGASNLGEVGASVNLWFIAAAGFVALSYAL